MKSFILAALATAAVSQGTQNLTAALASNPNLSQLARLISASPNLASSLTSTSNITILAPNNDALSTLLNSTAGSTLTSNPDAVNALLSYHVLQGTFYGSQISNTSSFIPTLLQNQTRYANVTGGQRVEAVLARGNVTFFSGLLQNTTVTQANQNFTGGTIHVVNRVLTLPGSVSETLTEARLSSLYGALNRTNLLGTVNGLKDVTIFAPNNSAFQAIGSALANVSTQNLSSFLTYHVVNGSTPLYSNALKNGTLKSLQGADLTVKVRGGSVYVNNAKVITPNVLVAGGVVHVIDAVLNPGNATATVPDSATTGAPAFPGSSTGSDAPFTSGQPTASRTIGSGAASATASSASKSSTGAAMPMKTGAIGAAALFGVGAMFVNL